MQMRATTRRTTGRTVTLRGAVAIIERDGKILLQKRGEHIADPGTWILPGGEILPKETTRETLVRVCGDELGITVRPHKEICIVTLGSQQCPVWHVLWKGKDLTLGGEKTTAVGWFTVEELLTLEPVRYQDEFRDFLRSEPFFIDLAARNPLRQEADERTQIVDPLKLQGLVRLSKEGDHEAFGEIYDLFVMPIYRYVSFRVPAARAEDLVSDVFVKAWEKLDRYRERLGTPFSSWLFRIASNVVIDSYRTTKAAEELSELHIDEDRWNDPALKITQDIQCVLLRQALQKLPKRSRDVLLLSFMSNLSHHEIARSLRMREGSVRIVKHRALRKLESLLPVSMREELP